MISSTLPDGMYYELTFDGDKKKWYLDAYKKFENRVYSDDDLSIPIAAKAKMEVWDD